LTPLAAALEEEGAAVAAELTEAAEAVVAAYRKREAVAGEISHLAAMTGRVLPGDVSRSRAEALAKEAAALVQAGGEEPPVLKRDPRQPRHGAAAARAVA
jgi:hypothetical protein